jgi:hypothetical protein
MKLVTMTVLLFVSIGCMNPTPVSAEAPKPRGGCWSKDVVMRSIETPQPMTTIKGQVIAIDYNNKNQPIAAKEIVMWVRLKTASGSVKSIYLGSNQYLNQQQLQIQVRDVLEVQGVQTIKPKQLPTIVASTVKKGERTWKINQTIDKPTAAKWCQHNG